MPSLDPSTPLGHLLGNPDTAGKMNLYAVGASEYGGPNDPTTPGHTGSCGTDLRGKMAYAELGMGHNLGGLPCGTALIIAMPSGKQVIATKQDIGLGGSPVGGHIRCIDLWWETAQSLGFNGTGVVYVARTDGKPIHGLLGPKIALKGPKGIAGSLDQTAVNVGNTVSDVVNSVPKFLAYLTGPDFPKLIVGLVLLTVAVVEVSKKGAVAK